MLCISYLAENLIKKLNLLTYYLDSEITLLMNDKLPDRYLNNVFSIQQALYIIDAQIVCLQGLACEECLDYLNCEIYKSDEVNEIFTHIVYDINHYYGLNKVISPSSLKLNFNTIFGKEDYFSPIKI